MTQCEFRKKDTSKVGTITFKKMDSSQLQFFACPSCSDSIAQDTVLLTVKKFHDATKD